MAFGGERDHSLNRIRKAKSLDSRAGVRSAGNVVIASRDFWEIFLSVGSRHRRWLARFASALEFAEKDVIIALVVRISVAGD